MSCITPTTASLPRISVIVPTRNRPGPLAETLATLRAQDLPLDAYEIVVVDDGSKPALTSVPAGVRLERLDGRERSAARNVGAQVATGELLVFLDDDISVGSGFLGAHLAAHREWPGAIAVGATVLPVDASRQPFGRFRQTLEGAGIPSQRGVTPLRNFCSGQNMSIARLQFLGVGGFDEALVSAEDQDFALRHSEAGGTIVFLPEAVGMHRDEALDARSYCKRMEWGYQHIVAFSQKHPAWPDNIAREQVNGPVRLGRESVGQSARKMVKKLAGLRPILELLFAAASVVERVAPESLTLQRIYRMLLGVHIYRGYRCGAFRSTGRKAVVVSEMSPKGG